MRARSRADQEGERPRERDHPQPLALLPAAGIDADDGLPADVIDSVVELRQRRLQEQNISLTVEDQAGEPVTAVFTELQQVF